MRKECLNCNDKLDLSSFRFKAIFSQLILPIQKQKNYLSIALRKLNIVLLWQNLGFIL